MPQGGKCPQHTCSCWQQKSHTWLTGSLEGHIQIWLIANCCSYLDIQDLNKRDIANALRTAWDVAYKLAC